MVKDKLRIIGSSLKARGCFFCLRNKKSAVAAGIIFYLCFSVSPAFARQELEYDSVTGLWGYSNSHNFPSPSSSPQALEYNTVTGLWEYSDRDPRPQFLPQRVVGAPFTGALP